MSASNSGGCMGVVDMNGDGLDDIAKLDNARTFVVDYQNTDGSFTTVNYGSVSGSGQWGMAIADVDNNGQLDLFATDMGSDQFGTEAPEDKLHHVVEDGFYGWPYSYFGQIEDPRQKGKRPDLVAKALMPDVLFQAHSSSLGLVFYGGTMFPEEYRGDAFVAFHGSWNRSKRTGYKVVRVKFKDGRPVGGYDDFCVGWMLGEDVKEVWGRPVGLLVQADGSLLVVDDGANCVWRIAYDGNKK